MTEIHPDSRIQLRNRSELQMPAGCALCGKDAHPEGFVDFDIFVEFFGNFYLCMDCMNEAANKLGMLTTDETAHVKTQLAELTTSNNELTEKLGLADERLAKYDSIIGDALSARPVPTARAGDNARNVVSKPAEPAAANDKSAGDVGAAEAKPAKSGGSGSGRSKTARLTSSNTVL